MKDLNNIFLYDPAGRFERGYQDELLFETRATRWGWRDQPKVKNIAGYLERPNIMEV